MMNEDIMNNEYREELKKCALEALNRLDKVVDIDYLVANGTFQFADDMLGMMSKLIESNEWDSKRFD